MHKALGPVPSATERVFEPREKPEEEVPLRGKSTSPSVVETSLVYM